MTKHKTISSLSIAAIALVAAAAPALVQGQANPSSKTASVFGEIPAVEQTIAWNLDSSAVRKSRVTTPEVKLVANNAGRTNKTLVLSASAFKGQNHFTSAASNSRLATPQVNFKDAGPVDPQAKKQFRADESEISKTKQVTFVPSRGQKLPE